MQGMDYLSPQARSHEANPLHETVPYGTPTYHQQHQPPPLYMYALPYDPAYGAQERTHRNQSYYNPNSQNAELQSHTQELSRVRRSNRHHNSFTRSSTTPGDLGMRYVPTLSYSDAGSTREVPSNAPYTEPYGSSMRSYATSTHHGTYQSQLLQVPQSAYIRPVSRYGAHSAPTSPTASAYSMEAEALPGYSPHSVHSSHSQHPHDLPPGNSPHSSHSHLSGGSHRSAQSHSYHSPHASSNYSPRPLLPRHAHSASSYSHRSSHAHARSHSYQLSQASPTPGPSSEAVVFLPNVAIRVISSAPGPGPLVVVNVPQQYPQQTEQRKSSLFGRLANLLGRK